jgi:uncharacterized membrane protein YkgB
MAILKSSFSSASEIDAQSLTQVTLGATIESIAIKSIFIALVIVYFWFGGMKFTLFEAESLVPLVSSSPLLGWLYGIFSVRTFSTLLGILEISIGLLILARFWSPKLSAIGALLSIGLFATTLTFMASAPAAMEPTLPFPGLSLVGMFLLKDVGFLAISAFALGNSLRAMEQRRSRHSLPA